MRTQISAFTDEDQVTVRAHAAARAWLNVFLAAGDEDNRPALNRTLCVEWFDRGVQFISCNGTALFRAWVPSIPDEDEKVAEWPLLEEPPERTIIIMDVEGFGIAFMRSLLRVTNDEERQFEPLTITISPMDDGATIALGDEFQSERVTLRACGQRIDLRVLEAPFPDWRELKLDTSTVERVDGLSIAPHLFALVGKLRDVSSIDLEFYGDKKHVVFSANGQNPVRGLLMPMRRVKLRDEE